MFTGLIEKVLKVKDIKYTKDGGIIEIVNDIANDIKTGDSIAVNGICLTVNQIENNILHFSISNETLKISNIQNIKKSELVNIERAMSYNGRFDGHLVYGHIDGTAKIVKVTNDGFSYIFGFETTKEISKYIVKKGSVAINGISLTVANCIDTGFTVSVIPHTYQNTNLSTAKSGDIVNIETDIMSRYIEKFLFLKENKSRISMEMLKDNGYF